MSLVPPDFPSPMLEAEEGAAPVPTASEARLAFCGAWLFWFFLGMGAIGCLLVVAPQLGPLGRLLERATAAFWPAQAPPGAAAFQRWIYAVLGATLAGWALMGAWVARAAFARGRRWARDAIAAGVALWFVLDTAASVLAGVWANVAFNVAVVALLLPPLVAAWREFGPRPASGSAGS